jgi:hypothetical protein
VVEPGPIRPQPGLYQVMLVVAAVVLVVLLFDVGTGLLPAGLADIVFGTPLVIGVLIVATGLVLWRISRRRPPAT